MSLLKKILIFNNSVFLFLFCIINYYSFCQIRFDRKQDYQVGAADIQSVTIADVNNDCLNDVIVSTSNTTGLPTKKNYIQVFKQNINGNLSF